MLSHLGDFLEHRKLSANWHRANSILAGFNWSYKVDPMRMSLQRIFVFLQINQMNWITVDVLKDENSSHKSMANIT